MPRASAPIRRYESGGRFVPAVNCSRGNVPQLCGNQIRGRSDRYGDIAGFKLCTSPVMANPSQCSAGVYHLPPPLQLVVGVHSEASFRRHYKTSTETAVIETGTITTS